MQRLIKRLMLVTVDIFIINFSLFFAFFLKYDKEIISIIFDKFYVIIWVSIVITFVKITCFVLFKLYRSLWTYASIYELIRLLLALAIGNSIVIALEVTSPMTIPVSVFITAALLEILLIGGTRLLYRIYRRINHISFSSKKAGKRIMVIGGGQAGSVIIKELEESPISEGRVVAIIDDDDRKKNMKLHRVPIKGNRNDIAKVAKDMYIDEIIIAIPSASRKEINEIYKECSKTNCKVRILPPISQIISGNITIKKIRDVELEDLLGREPVKLDFDKISYYLKDKVVLITGGGGSIGSELCRQIAPLNPKHLIILDFYENNAYDIQNELKFKYPNHNISIVIANIREKERIDNIFEQYCPNVVFHAAAHKHVPLMEENPLEAIKNNVFGTINLVRSAAQYGTSRFILISTDKAVNPTNVMGATKRIAEMVIQSNNRHSKTKFAAVRFGNVLGSNGSVIPIFKKQIENGGPVTVTHPEVKRYFMTVSEAVQLVIQAGSMSNGGEIFVLDMGQPVKIYDLAKDLIRLSGYKPEEDIEIVFTGLRPGEKLYEELLLEEEGLGTTRHDKIFIVKPMFTDLAELKNEISVLRKLILQDAEQVIDYIPHIVPTYKRGT